MKNIALMAVVLMAAGMSAVGCANNKNAKMHAANESVTDVNVAPMPAKEPQVSFADPAPTTPAYAEPTVTATPDASASVAQTSAPSGGGQNYVVKKGDTLFSIAKATYGSGKEWQKIVNANPGLAPNTLKAGKTIVLP
jgi:nucleoid-associated protein YgaU